MSRINTAVKHTEKTHEGAPAYRINAEQQLRRSVMACMLWEKQFYEDGESIADRIKSLVKKVKPQQVADIAVEAREKMKLRHVPLLLVREMARIDSHKGLVAETLEKVIQRADELSEFMAIYWKEKKQPIAASVKKGLAAAFQKFNEYSLQKYNRDSEIKLRDVLFLCHAKPKDKAQEKLWKRLVNNELKTPDTWEVVISECKTESQKKKEWSRLLKEEKLGPLALLRNLRNMDQAGVSKTAIKDALDSMKTERVLPFRFISAARYVPDLEPQLETAMFRSLEKTEKLSGKTVLLIDISGSMAEKLSEKSELTRLDAGCGLAILLREICEEVEIITFNTAMYRVPPRRGFALRDAIGTANGGTHLGGAVNAINTQIKNDRLIVITDEQSQDQVPSPKKNGWMLNVSSYKNGVGYGAWNRVDGWSESVIEYIRESEKS